MTSVDSPAEAGSVLGPSPSGRPADEDERRARPMAPHRRSFPGASDGRLVFSQVREDSALDVEAIDPARRTHVVTVTSGGGTALAMLAGGARRVTAVDLNATQNDLAELQAVALTRLGAEAAVGYLGGRPMKRRERLRLHDRVVRRHLSPHAQATWDKRRSDVARGVLKAGVTERFLCVLVWVLEHGIVSRRSRVALLAATSIDEQRRVIRSRWDSRRWRLFFRLLLNRRVCRKIYSPAFFEHVTDTDFAGHFRGAVEHGLSDLAVSDNYFVHQMLEAEFRPGCLPPHLSADAARHIKARVDGLEIVDGDVLTYLRSQPEGSVDGVCLSNICEWLTEEQTKALLSEIVRVAAPNTPLVMRNFVGWTEVPASLQSDIVTDEALSAELSPRDRSLVQRRIIVACVRPT